MSKKQKSNNHSETIFKAACQDAFQTLINDLNVEEIEKKEIVRLWLFLNTNAEDAVFEGDSGIVAFTRGVRENDEHSSHLTVAYIVESDIIESGVISLKTDVDCFVKSDHYCLRKAVSIADFRPAEGRSKSKKPKQSLQTIIRNIAQLETIAVLQSSLPKDKLSAEERENLHKFLKECKKTGRFDGAQFHCVINNPSYQYTAQSTIVYKSTFNLEGSAPVNLWIRLSCFVEEDCFTLRKDVFTHEVKFNENPDSIFDSAEEIPATPETPSHEKANKTGSRGQVKKGARLAKNDSPLENTTEAAFDEELRIYKTAVEISNCVAISQESALLIEDIDRYDLQWSMARYQDDSLECFFMALRFFNQAVRFFLADVDDDTFEEWMRNRHDEFITVRETVDLFRKEHPNTP